MVELAGKLAQAGVLCLIGVSSARRRLPVDMNRVGRSVVLGNALIFGTVSAARRHYEQAVEALARADPAWLGGLISRRVPLSSWPDGLAREPGDVKVVVDLTHEPLSRTGRGDCIRTVGTLSETEHEMADTDAKPVRPGRAGGGYRPHPHGLGAHHRRHLRPGEPEAEREPGDGKQVGKRASKVDPVIVGAAAAAVLVGVTVLFLVRRRRR